MNKGFEIIIASLPGYNSVVAEIYYNNLFIALISQEKEGVFVLETPGPELDQNQLLRKINWMEFRNIADTACKKLNSKYNNS